MGFAFLASHWFEPRPRAPRCKSCAGSRGAIVVQYSLNVNQPQTLKEPICPRCERRWAEKTYPPIQWTKYGPIPPARKPARTPLKSTARRRRKKAS